MLNIRMSRTLVEGSPVPGCLTPGRAHVLMWSRFVPGTTKCIHPNRGHRSYHESGASQRDRSPLRERQRVEYLEECVHSPHGWPMNVD